MNEPTGKGHQELQSPDRLDPKVWKVIGVVLLGPLMAQMDSTIVNVSLSSIRDSGLLPPAVCLCESTNR